MPGTLGGKVASIAMRCARRERVVEHRLVGFQHRPRRRARDGLDRFAERRARVEDGVRAAVEGVLRERRDARGDGAG